MSWTVDGLAYDNRKKLTVDPTDIDADLTDFPVVIFITADADIGDVANADGFDIRFTTSDGSTLCKYERESWAVAGGQATAVFHVKLPAVSSAADTDFYIYYRTTDTADGTDPTNVWDANFVAVWHMNQDPSGGAPQILDSTGNNNDGTSGGTMTSGDQIAAKINGGLDFDGSNDYVDLGASASIQLTTVGTLEAWMRRTAGGTIVLIGDADVTLDRNGYSLLLDGNASLRLELSSASAASVTAAAAALSLNVFYYVAGSWDGTNQRTHLDGVQYATKSQTVTPTHLYNVAIARDTVNASKYFPGIIDEVRISNIARSAAWIRACYESQNNTMLTYGAEEVAAVASAGLSGLSGLSGLRGIC